MAKDKKGIGIIGYGGFGEFIHAAWDKMDEVHVVAACDSDPARDPGGISFYTDVDGFFADSNIDIVSIASPPSSHKELAIKAMQAGKHVLVEKPLAISESDAKEIIATSKETGMQATVNFVLRYNPIAQTLKAIIESELLGKLRRVDLKNYAKQDTVPEGHWFWEPQVSGRILVEHGVHFFDLATWMMHTKMDTAWSLGVERKPGMEDRVFAAVKYENDVVGTYWHSFSRPNDLETTTFHFAFDLGEIDMIGWIPLELNIWGWASRQGWEKLQKMDVEADIPLSPIKPMKTVSSEYEYDVEEEIDAVLALEEEKSDVYSECLRLIMADLVKKIDNPSHKMIVTLEDGLEAVRTAEQATKAAHP